MKLRKRYDGGFTLIEIIIVTAIIGLLAAIALPSLLHPREQASLNAIVSNLKLVEGAKDQWALENRKGTGDTPLAADIQPFIRNQSFPPSLIVGETYNINAVGTPADAITPIKLGTYTANSNISIP